MAKKIALELVRNKDGFIVDVFAINVGKMQKAHGNPDQYFQVINGKPVQAIPSKDVVIAEVYND